MFGVCGCVTVITCIVTNVAKSNVYVQARSTIREWVEINLNDKYQNQYGIRWNMFEERVTRGYRRKRRTITYLHIVVQCVDGAGDVMVVLRPQHQVTQIYNPNAVGQPQQIIYVDQNGNQVNSQKIQLIQVHNPDAVQNTAAATPVYALPYTPVQASAPHEEGLTNC